MISTQEQILFQAVSHSLTVGPWHCLDVDHLGRNWDAGLLWEFQNKSTHKTQHYGSIIKLCFHWIGLLIRQLIYRSWSINLCSRRHEASATCSQTWYAKVLSFKWVEMEFRWCDIFDGAIVLNTGTTTKPTEHVAILVNKYVYDMSYCIYGYKKIISEIIRIGIDINPTLWHIIPEYWVLIVLIVVHLFNPIK